MNVFNYSLLLSSTLVLLLLCSSCNDAIPAADDASLEPSDVAGLGQMPVVVDQQQERIDAIEFAITARSVFAVLGRSGAPGSERLFSVRLKTSTDLKAIQQAALQVMLVPFREQKQRILSYLQNRNHDTENETEALVEEFHKAADHIESTANKMITSGIMDRVHSLYVDRLDRSWIALTGIADAESKAATLPLAIETIYNYLDQLEDALWKSCIILQCRTDGVFRPLTTPERTALLIETARIISVEPALRSWLQSYELADSDREFLFSALRITFAAAAHRAEHHAALIHGAVHDVQVWHLAAHRFEWALQGSALTRVLLERYESTAAATN